MRKILASLFVIAGLVGVGVFATGAYFTDTVTQNNLTFNTGSASLAYGFCPPGNADCSSAPTPYHDLSTFPNANIGPGLTNADCLVIVNTGQYALNLTGGIATYHYSAGGAGIDQAFMVKAELANQWCSPGTAIFGSQSLLSAYNAGPQSFGSLAPGAKIYVVWSNSWNSVGNQNSLQNQWVQVDTFMTGQTV